MAISGEAFCLEEVIFEQRSILCCCSSGGFHCLFIYLFILVVLGLCCCTWAFSSCGERGLLFVAVHGLLIEVSSPVAEHGL